MFRCRPAPCWFPTPLCPLHVCECSWNTLSSAEAPYERFVFGRARGERWEEGKGGRPHFSLSPSQHSPCAAVSLSPQAYKKPLRSKQYERGLCGGERVKYISEKRRYKKPPTPNSRQGRLYINHLSHFSFLIFIFEGMTVKPAINFDRVRLRSINRTLDSSFISSNLRLVAETSRPSRVHLSI